jgi:hypothetical protein|tara:strand:+ start:960 stop:1556 length:597 start_codon:yes stop_codon:yes gene_type:complete
MNDYSVPKFDQSKIGKRIAKEQSEDVPHGTSQKSRLMEEFNKMKKEEILAEPKQKEERLNSPDEKIDEFLKKNEVPRDGGHFINRKLIGEILKIHPFIKSARQLSTQAKFPNNRYGQLNLKTKEWRRVDKQLIKSLASVLELKDWRVLIDHEMDKEYEKNQIKARDYLEKIKEIEKNIKEENPEQYEEEYSVFNVVGN